MMNLKHSIYWMFLFVLLIIALPVMGGITLVIALLDGFPILYRQRRVGLGGKPFTMYKFRTMVVGADRQQKKHARVNEADGPVFKIREDPRFTRTGRFLSHTGLDELPQIINVVRGEMALLGPRPLPVAEAAKLKKWQQARQTIKPGIISPWIMEGYHSRPFDEWMKSDIAYAKEKSAWGDLVLFGKAVVFVGKLFIREIYK
ncbi:sugar transferase, partial [Candidatus Gottesmanbacteria bacterium]|nr:sugar transferase [Candidatus Gottesmanbacteria bacterium]